MGRYVAGSASSLGLAGFSWSVTEDELGISGPHTMLTRGGGRSCTPGGSSLDSPRRSVTFLHARAVATVLQWWSHAIGRSIAAMTDYLGASISVSASMNRSECAYSKTRRMFRSCLFCAAQDPMKAECWNRTKWTFRQFETTLRGKLMAKSSQVQRAGWWTVVRWTVASTVWHNSRGANFLSLCKQAWTDRCACSLFYFFPALFYTWLIYLVLKHRRFHDHTG